MAPSSRALSLTHYTVGALMLLTAVLLVWHHFGMTRTYELSADSEQVAQTRDDRGDGGASVAVLQRTNGKLALACTLAKKFAWPYCGIHFNLGEGAKGMDLSGFDTMTVDIGYTGPGPHMLRAYIRNFEPEISTVGQWQSQKVNEVEFIVPADGHVVIPMKLFRTAAWWNSAQKTPLNHTDVRVNNVTAVELYTGSLNDMGAHQIELTAIRFHGKWISQNHLLMFLVGAWFCCGVVWPVLGLMHYRAQLRVSKARLTSLTGINRALKLEAKELAGQAYIDPLTGALNRQGLRELLVKQWKTLALLAAPSSVMFVDLDHFKNINDRHGHSTGDDVLRSFAAMVQREIRLSDKLVRWGGEEFLIVCPTTDAAQALALAEKLRARMALQAWPSELRLTASFGVTVLSDGEDIGEAIKRADEALYRAKANGRDRAELAADISVR